MSKRRVEKEEMMKAPMGKGAALLITAIIIAAGVGAMAYFVMSPSHSGNVNYENEGSGGSSVSVNPLAIMHVKSDDGSIDGDIKIELYKDKAPITVENFINYSKAAFYNGLVFHRVIPDFVVQGGGFYYGSDNVLTYKRPIYAPIKNEADNGLSNLEGTIAMARTSDPNSATSQFYFNLKDNTNLDYNSNNPGYCVFGKVISGWNLVQAMANIPTHKETAHFPQGDTELSDVPTVHITIVSVTIQNG